ncbi:MAG: TetR family transcriptional regulator [Burkholderiaceae bacterium]|nr:TetR family transcriptional regulator [Burkholderiaceae bacterium]
MSAAAPAAQVPARRRRDAGATRARILKAAAVEFAQHGFAGGRGERIARRAQSSERMVYYYFGSKDELFRAVLEAAYASLRDAERAVQLDRDDPAAALEQFCRFVWRYYAEHPHFISLLNTENLHRARHLRKSGRLDELVTPVVGLLSRLLAEGQARGAFRADVDPADLYVAIAGLGYFRLSNRHTLSAVLGRDMADPQELERYWELAARMIGGYLRASPDRL